MNDQGVQQNAVPVTVSGQTQRAVPATGRRWRPSASTGRVVVGGFFLVMGGVHLGLVSADPEIYGPFADHALFGFVRSGWHDIVMSAPAVYGLLLMAGEVLAGALLLAGGRPAQIGWYAVIVFHVLLMLFGWWVWAWSIPALVILVALARRDMQRRAS
jgi:hypothetical protein